MPDTPAAVPSGSTAGSSGKDAQAPGQADDEGLRVEEALASGDLAEIGEVLRETRDPIDRNRLLIRLIAGHYRLRSESRHRDAFRAAATAQIEEASTILDAIEAAGNPRPDYLEAFRAMAIVLDEDGRQGEAIAVCEKALSLGLRDGTKTGFAGRIERLAKRGGPQP